MFKASLHSQLTYKGLPLIQSIPPPCVSIAVMVFLTVLSFFPYALPGPGLSEERCVIPSDNVYFDGCEYNKKKGRSKEVVSVETERGSS
jgi:hypothetical protein